MTAILLLFFDICRFKRNPQDIPSSYLLKNFVILSYFGSGLAYLWLISNEIEIPTVKALLDSVLMLAMGYAALWTRGFEQRATQTITALFGSGTIIYLFSLPLVLLPDAIHTLLSVGLSFWSIAVVGHILSQALSIALGWGIGISFLYAILQANLFAVLFLPNQ